MSKSAKGSTDLRSMKSKLGLVEWGILAGVTILTASAAAAILGGLGLVSAVVALGHFLVPVFVYLLYRLGKKHDQK